MGNIPHWLNNDEDKKKERRKKVGEQALYKKKGAEFSGGVLKTLQCRCSC
jgi:hypothetical protein